MFQYTVQKHKLVYSQYLGDGEASSLKEVVKSNLYSEFDIVPGRVECVGHVQKRLGTRLRKIVKDYKWGSNSSVRERKTHRKSY